MSDPNRWKVLQGERDGPPVVIAINEDLLADRQAGQLPWHLSIIVTIRELSAGRLPTQAETVILDAEEADFERCVGSASGNARLLARITWSGTRRLLYRVADPKPAAAALGARIAQRSYQRPFDYRMESDAGWALASDFLGGPPS